MRDTITPIPDPSATPPTFTEAQVHDALNDAADDILDAVDGGANGLRDGFNLMVNATLVYLRGDARDLRAVADANYDDDLDTILGWIGAGGSDE